MTNVPWSISSGFHICAKYVIGDVTYILVPTGHHVHFSEDTDALGNTAIAIKEKVEGSEYEAHIGFLQVF